MVAHFHTLAMEVIYHTNVAEYQLISGIHAGLTVEVLCSSVTALTEKSKVCFHKTLLTVGVIAGTFLLLTFSLE